MTKTSYLISRAIRGTAREHQNLGLRNSPMGFAIASPKTLESKNAHVLGLKERLSMHDTW